jgi:SAM-dependent methyltransferase/ribosomal protein S18 acetylase RimI-like enzyme
MMIIEQAKVKDAEEILELQKLAYLSEAEIYDDYTIPPLTQTLEEIRDDFNRQLFLKATVDEQIIGSVRAHLEDETCFIGKLIVHPHHQNRGIGTKLMHEIEARFAEAERFGLFTGHRSERNLHLYEKLGYRIFRTEPISDNVKLVYLEKRATGTAVDQKNIEELQISYDRVAEEYANQYADEFDDKSLDRQLLDRLAEEVRGTGPVCDLGCGPGQVARYLCDRGVDAFGLDLSPGMVEQARQLNPGIEFKQGNMLSLDVEDESWGGIAAFYSIIHVPRKDVTRALRELARVLRPGGLLLLSFHLGQEVIHFDEFLEEKVSVDSYFFQRDEMEGYLRSAGFEIEDVVERPPYESVEYQSRRAYIFARKPRK